MNIDYIEYSSLISILGHLQLYHVFHGKKGEKVVNMNYEAVEQGKNALVQIKLYNLRYQLDMLILLENLQILSETLLYHQTF